MNLIKTMIRIVLLPVWMVLTALCLCVKDIMTGYSFVRAIIGTGLILLMAGTAICYHDWIQVMLLAGIMGILFIILAAGACIEVMLDTVRHRIIHF